MADEKETEDVNERVRRGLRTLVRNVILLVAVVALAYVAYMLFYGAAPRRDLETIDQTLISGAGQTLSYSQYVAPYVGEAATRPSITSLDDFLSYFDSSSRDVFRDNAEALVRQQNQFDPKAVDALDRDTIEVMAMQNLLNRPPLSGFARITAQRPGTGGSTRVSVIGRDGRPYDISVRQEGGLWRIEHLAGLRAQVEEIGKRFGKKE